MWANGFWDLEVQEAKESGLESRSRPAENGDMAGLRRHANRSRLQLDTASSNKTVARHAVSHLASTLLAVGAAKRDTGKAGAAGHIRDVESKMGTHSIPPAMVTLTP